MTELFLLGAGASVDAGVPGAYQMTNEMLRKFSEDEYSRYQRIDKVLQFVVGGLLFQQGIRGENPYDGVNIEDLFNAIILLGDRQNSELGPFISSWHPQLIGLESGSLTYYTGRDLLKSIYEPVEKHIQEVTKEITDALNRLFERDGRINLKKNKIDTSSSGFRSKFTEAVRQVVVSGEGKLFKATADAMILKLVEMVWVTDTSKVTYLLPLIQYANDTNSMIVTLNYDNTIELVGKTTGIGIDTGFDSWSNNGDFVFDNGKVPLLKLHGSIDWALSGGRTSKEKPLPYQIIERVDPDEKNQQHFQPTVIFGGTNKLTAKGPFLSLLRSFEQRLLKSEVLTVIGYSFRDEHVNEYITNWFNGDITRSIKIINPNPDSLGGEFIEALFSGVTNDRVQIIKETAANGISSLTKI